MPESIKYMKCQIRSSKNKSTGNFPVKNVEKSIFWNKSRRRNWFSSTGK